MKCLAVSISPTQTEVDKSIVLGIPER